jgi:transposase
MMQTACAIGSKSVASRPLFHPATRTIPYPIDRAVYRRRNLIERLFCRLKNWRRLATRYDRLARNYLAALALVAVVTEWT